jgi:quinol monooxygenase YgiN
MLIIAGHITVDAAARDDYVQSCVVVVEAARATPGCLDFSITADTVDPRRICIHERWQDEEPLLAFRSSGPSPEQQAAIIDADVKRYSISAIGEA